MSRTPSVLSLLSILALVLAVSCQEAPTSLDSRSGLDLAVKPDCSIDASHPSCKDGDGGDGSSIEYGIAVSGFVSGGGTTTSETSGVVARGSMLNLSALQGAVEDGEACFDGGTYTGPLGVREAKDGSITVDFYFEAVTKSGQSVFYNFHMDGEVTDGTFPPAEGETTTIASAAWSVSHDSGGPKKTSCAGSGSDESTITVTGIAGA